jgi:hypothetical protein
MAGVSNFDVLKRMGDEDKDIRMATAEHILRMQKVKAGTQITFGVQGDVIGEIHNRMLGGCFLLFNWEQFKEVRARMESEIAAK